MSSILDAIVPKSDQLNFDDMAGGQTKTIKVTKVSIGAHEQPVAINYEGDNGKPYKPCKSMCRVLVHIWGKDANEYVGRSMTLYGDPKVKFGGAEVGGIRISHMSNIKSAVTLALTVTKANRKPFTVHPLVEQPKPEPKPLDDFYTAMLERGKTAAAGGNASLNEWYKPLSEEYKAAMNPYGWELRKIANDADATALKTLKPKEMQY